MATSEFGKAFRAARNAGSTEFEFNGKKYNTKLKDEGEKKAAPKEVSSAKNISQEDAEKIAAKSRAITAGPPRSLSDPRPLSGTSISDIFTLPSAKDVSGEKAKAAQEKRDSSQKDFTKGTIFENFGDFGAKNVGDDAAKAAQDKRDSSQKDFTKGTIFENNKKGGVIKKMASGGMASSRGDGIAQRGKTRGKMC